MTTKIEIAAGCGLLIFHDTAKGEAGTIESAVAHLITYARWLFLSTIQMNENIWENEILEMMLAIAQNARKDNIFLYWDSWTLIIIGSFCS